MLVWRHPLSCRWSRWKKKVSANINLTAVFCFLEALLLLPCTLHNKIIALVAVGDDNLKERGREREDDARRSLRGLVSCQWAAGKACCCMTVDSTVLRQVRRMSWTLNRGKKSARKPPLGVVMIARWDPVENVGVAQNRNRVCFIVVLGLPGWMDKLLSIESMNGTHLKSSSSCQKPFTVGKCLH